jgi:hypothetical protein
VRIGGEYAGPAVIHGQDLHVGVTVHLVIEVDELEIDGHRVDGYRTWVGNVTSGAPEGGPLASAHELRMELPSGRFGACLVLDDLRIVGLGPAPFD